MKLPLVNGTIVELNSSGLNIFNVLQTQEKIQQYDFIHIKPQQTERKPYTQDSKAIPYQF